MNIKPQCEPRTRYATPTPVRQPGSTSASFRWARCASPAMTVSHRFWPGRNGPGCDDVFFLKKDTFQRLAAAVLLPDRYAPVQPGWPEWIPDIPSDFTIFYHFSYTRRAGQGPTLSPRTAPVLGTVISPIGVWKNKVWSPGPAVMLEDSSGHAAAEEGPQPSPHIRAGHAARPCVLM